MTATLTEHDAAPLAEPARPEADRRAVEVVRTRAAGHAHPAAANGLAPAAHPPVPDVLGALRREGSLRPAHPEYRHTPGVETTTGPLGQGPATAVGGARAARRERGLSDPGAPRGTSPFDHTIRVFASDGDLQEGVSHEASSPAGHQRLGNLVVRGDGNRVPVEGGTAVAVPQDLPARHRARGRQVHQVDRTAGGTCPEDVPALHRALTAALQQDVGRPGRGEAPRGAVR
jgi:transketolase